MRRIEYRRLRAYKYQLSRTYSLPLPLELPFAYKGEVAHGRYVKIDWRRKALQLSRGYAWDGPSGPAIDTDTFMRGSLVHDGLYQLIREGVLSPAARPYADEVMRLVCVADGMNRFRAWYAFWFVRVLGGPSARPGGGVGYL